MFFSRPGEFEKCNMFTLGHLILIIITIISIIIAVLFTKTQDKKKIRKIIQTTTIIAWVLEIIKIAFNFSIGYGKNPNTYLPCYYCSLLLYAGLLSSIGKGKIQRFGDVFLETGAIIAGITFILFPTTSLPEYPAFHFISVHSFFFHGLMIYLGIIMNLGKYCILTLKDIKYYASLIIGISIFAYIMNSSLGTNLMFISKDFPNTPLSPIYRFTGKYYGIFMILIQSFPPFYLVYLIVNKWTKWRRYLFSKKGGNMKLKINNIHKFYGEDENKVEVLKGVNCQIEDGQICVLLGPSGSGKSTLLNIIGGIEKADNGYVQIGNDSTANMNEKQLDIYRRSNLGFVFQFYNLIPNLTVKENIEVCEYLSKKPLEIDELIKTLGLWEHKDKFPNQLSGGQQQRCAIGRALVKNPSVLLCDEPTGALDSNTSREILELIEKINQKYNNTIIIVTHNEPIKQMAHKVLKIIDGQIVNEYINENIIPAKDIEW